MKMVESYEFSELSKEVQAKVLDDNRYWNVEHIEWYDCTIEDWKEKLKENGFEDAEISFSGFSSQGDGCSFKAKLNADKFLVGEFAPLANEDLAVCWEEYRGYSRYRIWKVEQNNYLSSEDMDALSEKFIEHVNSIKEDFEHDIYKSLEKYYDYLTSDIAVQESIEANERMFLANGRMV